MQQQFKLDENQDAGPTEKNQSVENNIVLFSKSNDIVGADHLFGTVTDSDVNKLESLFAYYEIIKQRIASLPGLLNAVDSYALYYMVEGNIEKSRRSYVHGAISQLTDVAKSIAVLDAEYWDKALKLTDVLDTMPSVRRVEWQEQISARTTPVFEKKAVISTLVTLLGERSRFFSERVDGVFQSLSKEHVTNNPAAFTKRFIISNFLTHTKSSGCEWWDVNSKTCGYVDDLRVLVNQISGRLDKSVNYSSTYRMFSRISSKGLFGQWYSIDGGAMRFKLFKVGTVHIEIHPDVSAVLNNALSHLYPSAIPSKFRKTKNKTSKTWPEPVNTSLSVESCNELLEMRTKFKNEFVCFIPTASNEQVVNELISVLNLLGGKQRHEGKHSVYNFDYDPSEAILDIAISGQMPSKKSHQFYPTTPELVEQVESILNPVEGAQYAELSAGTGALASILPLNSTLVEISPVFCTVLRSKGFTNVLNEDCLSFAKNTSQRFKGIAINPPYCNNQAKAHVESAATLLNDDGKLVAVVPCSLRNLTIKNFDVVSSEPMTVQFDGAKVTVVILEVTRI